MLRNALLLSLGVALLALLAACAASAADKQAALTDVLDNNDNIDQERRSFGVLAEPFNFQKCANEGGLCSCFGSIRYGVEGHWRYDGSRGWEEIPCTNEFFGDPIFGTVKRCECALSPHSAWTECAEENEECKCSGDVRFGVETESGDQRWGYRYSEGSITCDVDHFGDPIYGVRKKCYCLEMGWNRCANENGICQCASTWRIGANGDYRYYSVNRGIHAVRCRDGKTTSDGVEQHCDCYNGFLELNKKYTFCSNENDLCECPKGDVIRFGSGAQTYSDRVSPGDYIFCDSEFWGGYRPDSPDPDCMCVSLTGLLNPDDVIPGYSGP